MSQPVAALIIGSDFGLRTALVRFSRIDGNSRASGVVVVVGSCSGSCKSRGCVVVVGVVSSVMVRAVGPSRCGVSYNVCVGSSADVGAVAGGDCLD